MNCLFKKTLCLILALLMLAALGGCRRMDPPDVVIDTPVPVATRTPDDRIDTEAPTEQASDAPTVQPTEQASDAPTGQPTEQITDAPTGQPTSVPATPTPTPAATPAPTATARPTEAPDDSDEPNESERPVITASPNADPLAGLSPEAKAAVKKYELYPVDYPVLDRLGESPSHAVTTPRYTQGSDGVWRSSKANNDNEAVIMLTGDLMCQTRQQEAGKTEKGYDFTGSFRYVNSVFSKADLVIGNLEATLSERAPYMAEMIAVEERPHLNAPATFLEAIRFAGYDMVVMSNNHNCDTGVRGVFDTIGRVEEYKLIHTGTFRNENETRYTVIDVDGIKLGVMSYSTYFNHKEEHFTPEGVKVLLNPYSKEVVERDVKKVKAAGAEFVLVYIHWGVEYVNEPNDEQRVWAQELADAGVDYIIGSHPHALQPYDVLTSADGRRVPVVYSMGNFVSHQEKVVTKDTIILRVTLKKDSSGRVRISDEGYIPARVFKTFKGLDYAIVPVVKPYSQNISSSYFAPAYERITGIIGSKIKVLGTL